MTPEAPLCDEDGCDEVAWFLAKMPDDSKRLLCLEHYRILRPETANPSYGDDRAPGGS